MYTNIFDSHAHYNDKAFDQDRHKILSTLPNNGIKYVMNVGCSAESNLSGIELAEKYDYIFASVGIHPSDWKDFKDDYENILITQTCHPKVKAIGEIGLDYYYGKDSIIEQLKIFEKQLAISKELNMPVIIHDRDAHKDTLDLLKKYKPRGIVHCFSGSAEFAKEILGLGMNIGFTGVVTFKNARRALEALQEVPLERLLVETDCPYMAPEPFRGKRNYSEYIPYIAEKMAEIKKESPQKILDITMENALRIYRI